MYEMIDASPIKCVCFDYVVLQGAMRFFKKLYADADDDTRRAMVKSYQESGGTALSTNWKDVAVKDFARGGDD